jgi:phage shock protein A
VALEGKISEAKTKKNMLQARARAAKANEELQKTLGGIDTSSSMSAFERMETKVLELEARSQAVGELSGYGIEQQFAQLEAGSGVEDELSMLKAQIEGSKPQEALPAASDTKSSSASNSVVDAELEELRSKLKEI